MKILLTGATGFIGSHICRALVKDGHDVVILKRSFSDCSRLAGLSGYRAYDIDRLGYSEIYAKEGRVDCIIHTAIYYGEDKFLISFETDVVYPLTILDTFLKPGGLFLNTTTFFLDLPSVYPYMVYYRLAKQTLFQWLSVVSSKKDVHVVHMKLFHVYGPGDSSKKFAGWIMAQLANDAPVMDLTAGEQERDFIYVEDVADAYRHILQVPEKIKRSCLTIDVATGRPSSVKDFVTIAKSAFGARTKLNFGVLPYRPGEMMKCQGDPSILRALGWTPQFDLKRGLAACAGRSQGTSH